MITKPLSSWADRFAVLDHYKPADDVACAALAVTPDELATARDMRKGGVFAPTAGLDMSQYESLFTSAAATITATIQPTVTATIATPTTAPKEAKVATATTFAKPETASRKPKEPKKRGRKGDKIKNALLAVPSTPMLVDDFISQHGVSLAVLRQSKRFSETHGEEFVQKVGKINVRQDKTTKAMMIWKS